MRYWLTYLRHFIDAAKFHLLSAVFFVAILCAAYYVLPSYPAGTTEPTNTPEPGITPDDTVTPSPAPTNPPMPTPTTTPTRTPAPTSNPPTSTPVTITLTPEPDGIGGGGVIYGGYFYYTQPGDTLWAIAGEHYDDPLQWRFICETNGLMHNCDLIHANRRLYLPEVFE